MYNREQHKLSGSLKISELSFKAGEVKCSFQIRDGGVYPQCCFKSPEVDGRC